MIASSVRPTSGNHEGPGELGFGPGVTVADAHAGPFEAVAYPTARSAAGNDQPAEYTSHKKRTNTAATPSMNRPATSRKPLSVPALPERLDELRARRLSLRLPGVQRLYKTRPLPAYDDSPSASATSSATSEGFVAARMPAARNASLLASAVLSPPETIAPAWPIVLPSGAVKPAM